MDPVSFVAGANSVIVDITRSIGRLKAVPAELQEIRLDLELSKQMLKDSVDLLQSRQSSSSPCVSIALEICYNKARDVGNKLEAIWLYSVASKPVKSALRLMASKDKEEAAARKSIEEFRNSVLSLRDIANE